MINILVLAGGGSGEREVSLRSGQAVAAALQENNHQVTMHDPVQGLEHLTEALHGIDVVFPALHGAGGEDGTTYLLLVPVPRPHDFALINRNINAFWHSTISYYLAGKL
jgi:D-alanine-D-alanine ligase